MHNGNDSRLGLLLMEKITSETSVFKEHRGRYMKSAELGLAVLTHLRALLPLPALVHNLVAPAKETCSSKTMHNNYGQQRAWRWLRQVDQAKNKACQSNSPDTSPVPLAQSVIQRISCRTDQPSPANPPGPLCYSSPHKSPEKQLLHRSIYKQIEKPLQKVIADGGPAAKAAMKIPTSAPIASCSGTSCHVNPRNDSGKCKNAI